MSELFSLPFLPILNLRGLPSAGAKAFFYLSGTSTLSPVYADAGLTTPLSNPVVSDNMGRLPDIYLDGDVPAYRVRIIDAKGALLDEVDPYTPFQAGPKGDPGAGGNVAVGRTQLASRVVTAGDAWYLSEGARSGMFIWTLGNFVSSAAADVAQGLYVPHAVTPLTTGCWVRQWDGITGYPEWFGAVPNNSSFDCGSALMACHKLCPVMKLGQDYWTTATVVFDQSNHAVEGSAGSAEGAGGTRIIMQGPNAATATIIRVGTGSTSSVAACARRTVVRRVNTIRTVPTLAPVSGRREEGATGWLIAGLYESSVTDCFDFGSAVSYRIYGTCAVAIERCGCVRPTAGTPNAYPDHYTGFAIGGTFTSFGFIGANASLTVKDCYAAGAAPSASRVGVYLFGFIGDTWVDKFEQSQMEHGMYIDGADATGNPPSNLSAHQDVRINNNVLDNNSTSCITVRNINAGGCIQLNGNYGAIGGNGDGLNIDNCKGPLHVIGGDFIAASGSTNRGIYILNSKNVVVAGTALKDFALPVSTDGAATCRIEPIIVRSQGTSDKAVNMVNSSRCYVSPIIDGWGAGAFNYGVYTSTTVVRCQFNLTGISSTPMASGDTARRLFYDGATVTAGTFGTDNLKSGVVS